MNRIEQDYKGTKVRLVQTVKSVDWLINNTHVEVFDPLSFQGYQRQIDSKHLEKLVTYLKNNTLLPTAIICATDLVYEENQKLRIVDGQHRVEAFREISKRDPERYAQLKMMELPVTILEMADPTIEIDTFITINKTSKKVDTSLAFVLKNKINAEYASKDLSMPKRDYLAVELAIRLNERKGSLWEHGILLEGDIRNSARYVSLNAFVRSARSLIGALESKGIIKAIWSNTSEITALVDLLADITDAVWNSIGNKWEVLFRGNSANRSVIQGAIGYSSINRYLIMRMEETEGLSRDNIAGSMKKWIEQLGVSEKNWLPGGHYAGYTSASGYNMIARELCQSAR